MYNAAWLSYKVAMGSEEAAYTGLSWKVSSGWSLFEAIARQKSRRQAIVLAKPCRYVLKFVWLPASTTLWLCSLQLCDSDTVRSYENQIEKEVESFHHSVHLTKIYFQKQPSFDYQQ